jgi:TDG/mug DNA glycosylase family protein
VIDDRGAGTHTALRASHGVNAGEEVLSLPRYLRPGLRVVFIGYNPGLESARLGHYYAHHGNAFWRHLNASGLVPEQVTCDDDALLMDLAGIGFTDLCARPSLRADELGAAECAVGAKRLLSELRESAPRAAIFSGKQLYALFAVHGLRLPTRAGDVAWGLQPRPLDFGSRTSAWVIPSSSGLASRWHGLRLELLRDLAASLEG